MVLNDDEVIRQTVAAIKDWLETKGIKDIVCGGTALGLTNTPYTICVSEPTLVQVYVTTDLTNTRLIDTIDLVDPNSFDKLLTYAIPDPRYPYPQCKQLYTKHRR